MNMLWLVKITDAKRTPRARKCWRYQFVVLASTGAEAVELLRAERPDAFAFARNVETAPWRGLNACASQCVPLGGVMVDG